MKLKTPLLLLIMCLTGQSSSWSQENKNKTILRIDPTNSRGGSATEVIEEISFIPLESTSESVFGRIHQLEIADSLFIIRDPYKNRLLIFNKQGKFHAKIEGKKFGLTHEGELYFFYYNRQTRNIEIPFSNQLLCFDLDGHLVGKRNKFFSGISGNLGGNYIAFYNYAASEKAPDSLAYELLVTFKNKIAQKYFPYNMKMASLRTRDFPYIPHFNFYNDFDADSAVYFLRPFDYNIYKVTSKVVDNVYQLIFPSQNSLAYNFTIDSTLTNNRMAFLSKNTEIIHSLSDVYKLQENLFFKTDCYGLENDKVYVYNLVSGNLIDLEKISPDEKSYFLSITDAALGGDDFKKQGILASDGNSVFVSYSSWALFQQKETATAKKAKYPSGLEAYLKNEKNRKGNPVIIQMKFKRRL